MEDSIDTEYQHTRQDSPFDAVADRYDEEFEASPITHWLRSRIYAHIQQRLPQGARILDLACGTGTDAIELARRGYSVVGIDSSSEMIRVAKRKAGRTKQVVFRTASYETLSRLQPGTYDLVLSNFGGLNCTHRLDAVLGQVVDVVRPGGYFVGVLMPPFALWETLYALRHLHPRFAARRWGRGGTDVAVGMNNVRVYYYSTARIRKVLAPWFTVEEIVGLNILVPPPALKKFAVRHPHLVNFLCALESLLAHLPLLRSIGDHYMVVAQRRHEAIRTP
jgi:ubiquinone/menaquinone biosynthesis C-methylase UbiE